MRNAKAKAKAKAKPKGQGKTDKVADQPVQPELTKTQEYYIRGQMDALPVNQIAIDIGVPASVVEAFIKSLPSPTAEGFTGKMFQRPARGVVAMTEAASMRADDIKNQGVITQADINRAAEAGNYELAAKLVRQRDEHKIDHLAVQEARNGHFVHRPRGSGYEPRIDGRK
jgi:hypothetical protein